MRGSHLYRHTRLYLLLLLSATSASARQCSTRTKAAVQLSNTTQVLVIPPAAVFPRQDISDLISDPELKCQLDLFLQAYARVQQRPPTSPVSYFQLAAIHGQPYQAWDNVTSLSDNFVNYTEPLGGTRPGSYSIFAGYCWHASVLFPTWHRAYTLLMEQEVRHEASALALEYGVSQRPDYLEAAEQLRFPFWDWTSEQAGLSGLPDFMLQANVTVNTPTGLQSIRNPLLSFTLPEDVAIGQPSGGSYAGSAPSLKGDTTLRHPDSNLQSHYEWLQDDLKSEIPQSVRPSWYKLYTDPDVAKSWAAFATHTPNADGTRPQTSLGSIEGIHDLIHDIVGGIVSSGSQGYIGHMSDVDTAAFDPLFFLHHANVDRLTALFQQKNPGTWLQLTSEPYQHTYVTGLHGYTIDSSTPLWPFRKAENTFYTSDDVRSILSLGYTYPDFLTASENETVLFAPEPSPSPTSGDAECEDALPTVDAEVFKPDGFDGFRWYLNFRDVPAGLCPGSALVSVYLKDNPEALFSANGTGGNETIFAGSVAIFSHNQCETCPNHVGADGQVDLTLQLLELGLIDLRDEAYWAALPPNARPQQRDRPPPDLFETFLSLILSCPDGQVELSDSFKIRVLSLAWGRLVDGYQVTGM